MEKFIEKEDFGEDLDVSSPLSPRHLKTTTADSDESSGSDWADDFEDIPEKKPSINALGEDIVIGEDDDIEDHSESANDHQHNNRPLSDAKHLEVNLADNENTEEEDWDTSFANLDGNVISSQKLSLNSTGDEDSDDGDDEFEEGRQRGKKANRSDLDFGEEDEEDDGNMLQVGTSLHHQTRQK